MIYVLLFDEVLGGALLLYLNSLRRLGTRLDLTSFPVKNF
jgi:hypothetical protein